MVILREQKKVNKQIEERGLEESNLNLEEEKGIGIAVDIGTTTIAMTAIYLEDKKLIGQLSETNEQTKLGADVMMRIMHAKMGKAEILHQMIICQVEEMADRLLSKKFDLEVKELETRRIQFLVVGNTTMCHLFLNKNVEGLAGYPFKTAYTGNYQCIGSEVDMKRFGKAEITVLSGIAAHVGSDALAVIGAEQIYQKNSIQLAIDLGTNAEIVLNNKGVISVCSAAAGPAFEGKGIRCGMLASPGAVIGLKISKGNGNIILEYIGGEKPRGICGSGLVDILAELCRCNVLRADGYLLSCEEAGLFGIHPEICRLLVEREKQHAFLLYYDEETGKEVYILQSDIRNAQLAKGAIQAGILALLRESQISLDEVEEVFVAGVLGSCIRQYNAVNIGLLPKIDTRKMHFVGNAAGKGALYMLTRKGLIEEMEELAKTICHVELVNLPEFQELFLQAMDLKTWYYYGG